MASAGADMPLVDHVNTQLPYVMSVAAVSFVMFALAGFIQNALICLPIGIVLTLGMLVVLKKTVGKSVKDVARPPRRQARGVVLSPDPANTANPAA